MFKTISTLSQETRTPIDTDGDGTIDRIEFDTDGDGTPDRIVHLNADGRWERVELDADDDGNIDQINHYTFDDDGNRIRTRIDFDLDDDGTIDRVDHYTFDDDGTRSLIRTRFDDDGDGNFDRIEAYTYDGDGNRTRTRFDDDADGNFDRSETDFDADGNIDQIRFDDDDDGNIDRIEAYTYDRDGNRTRTRFDDDADGNFDRSETDFDADGNIDHIRFDDDDDGTNDRSEFYTYNSDGGLIRTRFDDDADGNFDRSETDFDADGNINKIRFDDDDDGNFDRSEFYTYNSDGGLIRTRFDDDDDGNIDRSEFDTNGDGNINQIRFDDDDDGTNDRSEFYTYNSDGNRTRTRFDDDADGNIDRIAFDTDGDGTPNQIAYLNADGRWERVELDADDDGNIDQINHYSFDDDGPRSLTRIDFDLDDDGNINRTAHLNADGRWERVELDLDDDGNIDRIDHYSFAVDGTRSLTRTDFDGDGDGITDRSEAYIYNGDGNRIRTRFDDDNDGNIDRTVYLNADGRWERVELDADDDGNIDRIDHYSFAADGTRSLTRTEAYTYNSDGRLIRTDFDDDNDGTTDRSEFDDDADGNIDRVNVAENRITAYRAPDAEGDTLVYSLSGTDAALFTIDAATGEVSFIAAPDFEAPGDDGGDNVYDIIVTASDGTNSTDHNVAITVTNDNDNAPTFTSPATANARENQTAAYMASATDADGDTLVYSLSGTDSALFTIDAATGEVSFIEAPDFEAPGDDGGDNIYDIIVTASDGTTDTEQAVAITVTNDNDNIPVFTSPATANAQENQTVAYMAAATDADGDTLVYSLSGTDSARFTIDAATGEVSFIEAPDFEAPGDDGGDNVYDIIVTASDGTNSTNHNVAITVTDVSEVDNTYDENGTLIQSDFDDDGDGTADRSETYTYDAIGILSGVGFDDDNDGTLDRSEAYTYSPFNGRLSRVEFDDDGDSTTDRSESYVYNSRGRLSQANFDDDGDGTTDRSEAYEYNLSGRLSQTEFDDDNDGTTDRSEAYTYNSDGDLIRTEFDDDNDGTTDRSEFDDDNDGTTDRSEAYTYNSDGDLIRTDFDDDNDGTTDRTWFDDDGDGTTDRRERYTLNEGGNRIRTDFDDDGDGTTDRAEHYFYDENNRLIRTWFDDTGDGRIERAGFDDDGDGTTDRRETFIYAADGARIRTDLDDDNDGIIDRAGFDDDGDFNFDRIETYTIGMRGNLFRTRFDDNANGTIDRIETYSYDDNRNRIRTDFDDNSDGTTDRSERYTLNEGGNRIRTDFDDDGDGVVDRIERALSSLNGTNGFILNGIDAGDGSGFSVSSAGDVNGDGYDDLIIGANSADSQAGETYIVYGGANAPGTDGVLDLSDLDGSNGFTLSGIDANDQSGFSVSSAGDVNGDGYDDLIIGAWYADPNGDSNAGETYIVYGGASAPGTDGVLDLGALDGSSGFILTGIDAFDQSGRSVSSAGDVNGDGYDDLIIGARGADQTGNSNAGETYLVYGGASAPGTDGVLDLSMLNGTNGFTLTGIDTFDQSGWSVSSAGDINGDGYDDLIIGAAGANPNGNINAGETYVIYGGASAPGTNGVLDLGALNGTNGFILTGIDERDRSGYSVSSAGDINGDGYDDLIIGAIYADPNGNFAAGETYIVYGGASAPGTEGVLDLSGLDGTNGFILTGIDAGDRSGSSVSSAGDVNGDGYDDLIIGARRADPNGDRDAGETYIIYGGASAPGTGGVLDLGALGTNGFILTGIDVGDNSGSSVSSAGDVNGDGYDDLIIGAWGADPNGDSDAGETYIVYGGATGTESLVPVTASGTAAADNFTGNAGADSFTAIATNDVVRGGAGDDTIRVTALDFAAIDGGTGVDTLVLDGAGLALDLTGPGHAGVNSVELFDLSGTGANSLVLDALAVFDVTEEREGGVVSLDVLGDADDRVDLSGSNFALTGTAVEDGVTYNVYRDGNAQLRIENGVSVTLAAAGAQSARSKTDTGTDPESGTRLDGALMNPDPLMNNDLWGNDLWDGLWADGVKSLDQPVHMDEDAILIPLSDPLSFGPLASGPLAGPWGDLMCWPGLGSHPAMQNDLAMILPEMEIVTAYMEGF